MTISNNKKLTIYDFIIGFFAMTVPIAILLVAIIYTSWMIHDHFSNVKKLLMINFTENQRS